MRVAVPLEVRLPDWPGSRAQVLCVFFTFASYYGAPISIEFVQWRVCGAIAEQKYQIYKFKTRYSGDECAWQVCEQQWYALNASADAGPNSTFCDSSEACETQIAFPAKSIKTGP